MKKTILPFICISCFILLNSNNLFGQTPNWDWANSYGSLKHEDASANATDAAGNVFVIGYFSDTTLTIGTITLINANTAGTRRDMFIAKFDNLGNVIWAKRAGGLEDENARGIAVDASGNCYVTGSFGSASITFGPFTLTNAGVATTPDVFLVKYDAMGNELMAIREGGVDNEWGSSIAVDVSGNIYISGKFYGPTFTIGTSTLNQFGNGDIFIAKYDATGNPLWAISAGGNDYEDATSIVTDHLGNIIIVGDYISPTITFGSITLTITNTTYRDIFIAKYNSSGTVQWVNTAVGTQWDFAGDVSIDAANNAYFIGYTRSQSITFNTTTLQYNSGLYQMFLVKYDASGSLQWAKNASTPTTGFVVAQSIATDSVGNSYVSGEYSDTVTFGTFTLNTTSSDEVFIAKYNAAGGLYWIASSTGTNGSGVNAPRSIAIDNLGNSYVTGIFYSSGITFGTSTLTNANSSMLSTDFFIAKLNSVGTIITEVNEGPSTDELVSIYPNPFNSFFTIISNEIGNAHFVICNSLGEIVYEAKLNGQKTEIDMSAFASGVYIIHFDSDRGIVTRKIINE